MRLSPITQALLAIYGAAVAPETGLLTPLSPTSVSGPYTPRGMAIHPNSEYLYIADGANIVIYQIHSDGTLSLSSTIPPVTDLPQQIVISADGLNVYVSTAVGGNNLAIHQYAVSGGGSILTPLSPASIVTSTFTSSSSAIVMTPDDNYLYVTDFYNFLVFQLQRGVGGVLSLLTPNYVGANKPTAMAITPNGFFAYIPYQSGHTIQMYSIISGLLAPLSPATVNVGSVLYDVKVSPDGNYLYVTSISSNAIFQFSIDYYGQLTPLSPASVSFTGANKLSFSKSGKFLFCTSYTTSSTGNIGTFSISSGLLTHVSDAAASSSGNNLIATTKNGEFVYSTGTITTDTNIYQFSES